jgi:hypothetical protein
MDSEEYFDRVIRYLETNGWNTSPSQLNERIYLVTGTRKSDTYYDRMLTLVVVDDATPLTEDHVGYLIEAAEEHEVDQTMAASRAGMTDDSAALVADHDVTFLDNGTIDDAFVDDFAVDEDSGGLTSTSEVDRSDESGQMVVTLDGGLLQLLVGLSLLLALAVGLGVAVLGSLEETAVAAGAIVPPAVFAGAPALALATGVAADALGGEGDLPAVTLFAGNLIGYLAFAFVLGVVVAGLGETGASVAFASVAALLWTAAFGLVVAGIAVAASLLTRWVREDS